MISVYINWNPFKGKTDIIVNDMLLKNDSELYDYDDMRIKRWIGPFIDDLVKTYNDENIEIIFRGLSSSFKELDNAIYNYGIESNINISLKHEICKSQLARIGALTTIINEIVDNKILKDEISAINFEKRIKEEEDMDFNIVVFSSDKRFRVDIINSFLREEKFQANDKNSLKIINDDNIEEILIINEDEEQAIVKANIPFVNSKHIKVNIVEIAESTRKNNIYNTIKNYITLNENNMMLIGIDEILENNNEEIFNLISEEYNISGNENIIFISKDKEKAKEYLYSEYAMEDVHVYSLTDIIEIEGKIKKNIYEGPLVAKVKNIGLFLNKMLEEIKFMMDDVYKINEVNTYLDEMSRCISDLEQHKDINSRREILYDFWERVNIIKIENEISRENKIKLEELDTLFIRVNKILEV